MNQQHPNPTPDDRNEPAGMEQQSPRRVDGGNPNDNLEAPEQELRDGPAPLGEDGGAPGQGRSNER